MGVGGEELGFIIFYEGEAGGGLFVVEKLELGLWWRMKSEAVADGDDGKDKKDVGR